MSNGTVKNMGASAGGGSSLSDGTSTFRTVIRSGALCIDKTLTALGFAGTESADLGVTGDWVNLVQF